jgi:hypothetical protein
VKSCPSVPSAADAPARLFETGHLWVLEQVDGALLRFQLQTAGFLRFADRTTVYDDFDAVPYHLRPAVRHVREQLDRDALRAAVDDVEQVVFFGRATHHRRVDYDWDRTPPFLGVEVWDGDEFLTPGAANRVFERLGLRPATAVERELPARDFDPDSYTVPDSTWCDGPAAGVRVRNKRGDRATISHPDTEGAAEPVDSDASADDLAARYATDRRLERLAAGLEADGDPVVVDTLQERAIEDIARAHYRQLYRARNPVDMDEFRSAVAARVRAFLTERYG